MLVSFITFSPQRDYTLRFYSTGIDSIQARLKLFRENGLLVTCTTWREYVEFSGMSRIFRFSKFPISRTKNHFPSGQAPLKPCTSLDFPNQFLFNSTVDLAMLYLLKNVLCLNCVTGEILHSVCLCSHMSVI